MFPIVALLFTAVEPWDPKLAAQYLDARQKEWESYATAKAPGGQCTSCHTGVLYALVRPVLRKSLGEGASPNSHEMVIAAGLRARLANPEGGHMFPGFSKAPLSEQAASVEAIIGAVLLPGDEAAMDRMWRTQIRSGQQQGAWPWFNLQLEPWEGPQSVFFGAALAAMAVDRMPPAYRKRPNVEELQSYLSKQQASQPLHNRLMLLWSSAGDGVRKDVVDAAWKQQSADGSWTQEALGPWSKPLRAGSNDYATALAAVSLRKAGVKTKDPRMARALSWLAARQDRAKGNWSGQSMNKERDPASMTGQFMNDAATALASLALTAKLP